MAQKKSIFSVFSKQSREERRLRPFVLKVNEFEEEMRALPDDALPKKTSEFRERVSHGEQIEDFLPEVFAVCREAARRTLNMRHFDVQIMGGKVLFEGKIAEMATGEGKTLVATLPAYATAVSGKHTTIVTVNDYLARRDSEWMGPVYSALGLTVGLIQHEMNPEQRRKAYSSDVTYVTNNEVGFDYLRDNMAISKEDLVLGSFDYAIIDEVDSILIDEARTPLIISGPAEESTDKYYRADRIVPLLKGRFITEDEEMKAKNSGTDLGAGFDYLVEEKNNTVVLTDEGAKKCERLLGEKDLFADMESEWLHHITQALRAHNLFKRDIHYVVQNGQVVIVDEFTGRLMPGRRWSEGLHQAVEAKEHLQIARENQTLATITFQNFFKLYSKLAGMTGTAATEAREFWEIYKLDVVVIPTNRELIRLQMPDRIFKTMKEKNQAIVRTVKELQQQGRPVLVGTRSIEYSEQLSTLLNRANIPHTVLNAKYHAREAQIVAQTGRKSSVTIATNMAGRGTDILLGGNPDYLAKQELITKGHKEEDVMLAASHALNVSEEIEKLRKEYQSAYKRSKEQTDKEHEEVVKLGGLHILGTERHEARRIDNQLRGRAGRQGDPGSSQFILSLEDELLRLFGGDRIARVMDHLGIKEGEEIQHPMVTRAIEVAQKRIEGMNFGIRKQLLDFDNVMDSQRRVIYAQRKEILESDNLRAIKTRDENGEERTVDGVVDIFSDIINSEVATISTGKRHPEEWDWVHLDQWLKRTFGINLILTDEEKENMNLQLLQNRLTSLITDAYNEREKRIGPEDMRHIEKMVMLQVTDRRWKEHLYDMDQLRRGIGLRAYGQKDPVIEYKQESFRLFLDMLDRIKQQIAEYLFHIGIAPHPVRVMPRSGLKYGAEFAPSPVLPQPSMPQGRQQGGVAPEGIQNVQPGRGPGPEKMGLPEKQRPIVAGKKIGRNDPCPCGSGKKYKKCCGRNL